MSAFCGRQYRGAMRDMRAAKRAEAEKRNKDTDPKNRAVNRRRAHRERNHP